MILARRDQLEKAGFTGFFSFQEITDKPVLIPPDPGVYSVLLPVGFTRKFLKISVGGWHKGIDPSVPIAKLKENWVEGVEVLYFGKAEAGKNARRGLRKRIGEYAKFGAGKPIGHSGGRYIWQLEDSQNLLVCWKTCDSPTAVEEELLRQFVEAFQRRPFANLTGGMKQ